MSTPTKEVTPARPGIERTAPPCAIVIFGASGDLTNRKLLPALYNLALGGLLSDRTMILGFARHDQSDDQFRENIRKGIDAYSRTRPIRKEVWEALAPRIEYLRGNYDDPSSFEQLRDRLALFDREHGTEGHFLFYIATPPNAFTPVVQNIGKAGLAIAQTEGGWARLVIEKPFGHDLDSARALNAEILSVFTEDQVFRIDHYLGKETVQNILAFRFANRLWEPIWSSQHIDHVQITVAESIGIEGRAGYYENAGALRDVVQNHMLQLVALVAMEAPITFEAEAVRDEKAKVLKALHPLDDRYLEHYAVRGQYVAGAVDGKLVPGYLEEPNVDPHSQTETYAAVKVGIDSWRWAGTPFYLRHGKRLGKRVSEIVVQFKPVPHLPFAATGTKNLEPDMIILRIQPDEGIVVRIGAKQPGPEMQIRSVDMQFGYETAFSQASPDAYERLILDCALGEHTLFTRADEVERSWTFIDQVEHAWQENDAPLRIYRSGSWGPDAADDLIKRDGRSWHNA